jgi:hypothetical protein
VRARAFSISLPAEDVRVDKRDLFPSNYSNPPKKKTLSKVVPTAVIRPKKILAHLTLHILSIILSIDITRRRLILHRQGCIPNLSRQPVFQVEQACLANILDFGACLANNSRLESRALTWIPAKDGEGPSASTTGTAIFLFRLKNDQRGVQYIQNDTHHADKRICTKT